MSTCNPRRVGGSKAQWVTREHLPLSAEYSIFCLILESSTTYTALGVRRSWRCRDLKPFLSYLMTGVPYCKVTSVTRRGSLQGLQGTEPLCLECHGAASGTQPDSAPVETLLRCRPVSWLWKIAIGRELYLTAGPPEETEAAAPASQVC